MSLALMELASKSGCELPFMQKPAAVLDTAFDLYGFLPTDDDQRWSFLERYEEVKSRTGFRPINFANAWGATYLSSEASFRRGFITTINPENCLQLDRALDNLSLVDEVRERYEADKEHDVADMELTLTDRIADHAHQPTQSETPCPEALYQIRLYFGQYLARVGFNLHQESESNVLSIVNIQGVPAGRERVASFEAEFGINPFNLLVQKTVSLSNVVEPKFAVRGLINPSKGNSKLYWGVLSAEGVDMYHAHRKPAITHRAMQS